MKRIPFTLEAWKAGGVPVTRSGEYVKQLTYFEGIEEKNDYPMIGIFDMGLGSWKLSGSYGTDNKEHDIDLFLEIPCTKYYTHYYRDGHKEVYSIVTNNFKAPFLENKWEYIKTVEVEL